MTTPATTIKDEVRVLIDAQIETFGQPAPLTPSQLLEFHDRSDAIRMLCQELNRIRHKGAFWNGAWRKRLSVSKQPVTSSSFTRDAA